MAASWTYLQIAELPQRPISMMTCRSRSARANSWAPANAESMLRPSLKNLARPALKVALSENPGENPGQPDDLSLGRRTIAVSKEGCFRTPKVFLAKANRATQRCLKGAQRMSPERTAALLQRCEQKGLVTRPIAIWVVFPRTYTRMCPVATPCRWVSFLAKM